tara:strand:- start:10881 stop:14507 length:3627 start_codon:yes stop_codon:yes gene_type:complete
MNIETLTFLSASNIGSWLNEPSPGAIFRLYSTNWHFVKSNLKKYQWIPNDFVGLNTNINEPLSPSQNFLGHPSQTKTSNLDYTYQGGLIYGLASGSKHDNPDFAGTILNGLIHHRQGPYGWPTWKQIRGARHPLARHWRKNNTFSFVEKTSTNKTIFKKINGNQDFFTAVNVSFQEVAPALSSRYKALEHNFVVEQNEKLTSLFFKHSYGNIESHYSSEKINFYLQFSNAFKQVLDPIYDDLKKIYITKDFAYDADASNPYGKQVPFKNWRSFIYSENVFPKEKNSYLAKTRKRTQYAEVAGTGHNGYDQRDFRTFWKNNLLDRNLRTKFESLNSQDYSTFDVQSVWSLDTDVLTGSRSGLIDGLKSTLGELQTGLGFYSYQDTDWAYLPGTASVMLHRVPIQHINTPDKFDQWVHGVPNYATNLISGKSPFFNSYEDFIEDIRGTGKSYSIIPEFKISDHMLYYVDQKEGNFLAKNDKLFSLPGASITSSVDAGNNEDSGVNEQFFLDYSNSDFMKYFATFNNDHKNETIDSYTFKVKGIKKLLPYRGFYPSERVVQLGTLLSQSYSANISGNFGQSGYSTADHKTVGLNAFLRQIISPGVVCNTLKSGIAVDFPALRGALNRVDVEYDNANNRGYWDRDFNFRFPFETAIAPHRYFPEVSTTQDNEIHYGEPVKISITTVKSAVSWNGKYSNLYTLAANNFFGEIPKFFLKDEELTHFSSARENKFKEVEAGKYYYMDVVLKRSNDMVLCEGQYEAGASPYSGSFQRGTIYGPPISSSWAKDVNGSNLSDPAYAPFTPPYFYEDSIARILYIPTTSGQPTLSDILSQAKIAVEYTGSSGKLGLGDAASRNKMPISASINLFQRAESMQAIYDAGGNFIEFRESKESNFDFWSIGTKFECPNLNFSGTTDYHSPSTGRGLWGGYGSIPAGSTGVYLELKDSFKELSTYSVSSNTGSLIDVCGFKAEDRRVGKVASEKTISEAIVAIPYIWESDLSPSEKKLAAKTFKLNKATKRKFFSINKNTFKRAIKDANTEPDSDNWKSQSITDMILKMRKYNFPPEFDFLKTNAQPFAMYVFEFEHKLSQQDLSDIWQGLTPEISRTGELQECMVSHQAGPKEFFQGKKLPKYTRWMVFKVKRKAEMSYSSLFKDQLEDPRVDIKSSSKEKTLPYNYNWPYDFFSLVELARLEANVEFSPLKTDPTALNVKSN